MSNFCKSEATSLESRCIYIYCRTSTLAVLSLSRLPCFVPKSLPSFPFPTIWQIVCHPMLFSRGELIVTSILRRCACRLLFCMFLQFLFLLFRKTCPFLFGEQEHCRYQKMALFIAPNARSSSFAHDGYYKKKVFDQIFYTVRKLCHLPRTSLVLLGGTVGRYYEYTE